MRVSQYGERKKFWDKKKEMELSADPNVSNTRPCAPNPIFCLNKADVSILRKGPLHRL